MVDSQAAKCNGVGGLLSIEEAYLLLTQMPRVWFPAFLKKSVEIIDVVEANHNGVALRKVGSGLKMLSQPI